MADDPIVTSSAGNFQRAATRALEQYGRELALSTAVFETDAEGDPVYDDYGDPAVATHERATGPGEVILRGTPAFTARADGEQANVDAFIWLPPTVEDAVTVTNGSDTHGATLITDPGTGTYRVQHVHTDRLGRLRCTCELV